MENLKICKIDSYNVYAYITEFWRYIVDVDEIQFNNVIDEAKACAKKHNLEFKTEIDEDLCSDGIIYKNFKLDDRVIAYIQYISIEDDDI